MLILIPYRGITKNIPLLGKGPGNVLYHFCGKLNVAL